jgi:hypothetical protein
MAVETSLLDVDHIEAAAKSTDNITLKHEAGRPPFSCRLDLGLVPTRFPLL